MNYITIMNRLDRILVYPAREIRIMDNANQWEYQEPFTFQHLVNLSKLFNNLPIDQTNFVATWTAQTTVATLADSKTKGQTYWEILSKDDGEIFQKVLGKIV